MLLCLLYEIIVLTEEIKVEEKVQSYFKNLILQRKISLYLC